MIIPTLQEKMSGPQVAALQATLKALLALGKMSDGDDGTRGHLASRLADESARQTYGDATAEIVRRFQAANGLDRTGQVEEKTAATLAMVLAAALSSAGNAQGGGGPTIHISGTVIDHLGRPREGVPVTIEIVHPGGRAETIASATTGPGGSYSVACAGTTSPTNVRARVAHGSTDAFSAVILNSPPTLEDLDVVLPNIEKEGKESVSDFDRVGKSIRRALERHAVAELATLRETPSQPDASLLAAETGLPVEKVILFIAAQRIQKESGEKVSAELAYGLGSVGVPFGAAALLKMSRDVLAAHIERAVKASTVSNAVQNHIDGALAFVRQASMTLALDSVLSSPFGEIFKAAAGGNEKTAREFFTIANADYKDAETLWRKISENAALRPVAADLRFAAEATMLVGAQPKAVAMLQRLRKEKEIDDLSALSKWTADDWEKQLERQNVDAPGIEPGASEKVRTAARRKYALGLDRVVEATHSRLYARHRIANSKLPGAAEISDFLYEAVDFTFTGARPAAYLIDKKVSAKLASPESHSTLLKLGRVARAARRIQPAIDLVTDGLNSAHSMAAMGPRMFARKYGGAFGGEVLALEAHARAAQTTAMSAELMIQASSNMDSGLNILPPSGVTAIAAYPDWATLFGAEDGCACEDCAAVTSPGAYLVDVLQFLKRRVPPGGGPNALSVLRRPGRRPDITEIELTCENTETVIPYIDLVNEALEDCVAPLPQFTPENFVGPVATDPGRSVLPAALRDKLNAALGLNAAAQADFAISSEATLYSLTDGRPWTGATAAWRVEDPLATYTIAPAAAGEFRITARGRNTRGPSQLRLLSPQYINARAYRRLSSAYYPWTLPFNRALVEARVGLQRLERPLADVLEAFAPGAPEARRQRPEVLRERLGLSEVDVLLITWVVAGAPPELDLDKPWLHFGFSGEVSALPDPADVTATILAANWVTTISSRVDVFLNRTQLTIDDLLALLDTRYINPVVAGRHSIEIVATDERDSATCQTRKLKLTGLDRDALVRIVRMARLALRSGLTYREIDQALSALNFAEPNANFLNALGLMVSLRDRLGADWAQLAATFIPPADPRLNSYWEPTGADRNIDHEDGKTELAPTLYEQVFRPAFNRAPGLRWFPPDSGGLAGLDLKEGLAGLAAAFATSSGDVATLLGSSRVMTVIAGMVDTSASLANLARLHRHALVISLLGIEAADYLKALQIFDSNPFASPAALANFLATIQRAQESSLSMDELRWLTRRATDLPDTARLAADTDFLSSLRSALSSVIAGNRFVELDATGEPPTADADGSITQRKLIAIGIPASLASAVVQALSDTASHEYVDAGLGALGIDPATIPLDVYRAPLAVLPAGVDLTIVAGGKVTFAAGQLSASAVLTPDEREAVHGVSNDPDYLAAANNLFALQDTLQGRAQFDPTAGRLRFNGPMPTVWRTHLAALGPVAWQNAVDAVRAQSRDVAQRVLRAWKSSEVSTALPTGLPVKLPPSLDGRLFFDASTNSLRLKGPLLPAEKETLKGLASQVTPANVAFVAALDALDIAAEAVVIDAESRLMTLAEIDALLDQPINSAERYRRVLQILLPRAAKSLSEAALFQALAGTLGISNETAERLARFDVTGPGGARTAREILCDDAFVNSQPAIVPSFQAAQSQHEVLRLLQYAALLAQRFNLLAADFTHLAGIAGWPNLSLLPTQPLAEGVASPVSATDILRFADYRTLRDRIPGARDTIVEITARARTAGVTASQLRALAAERLQQSEQEMGALCDATVFNVTAVADFLDERSLLRLTLGFEQLDQLGLSARAALLLRTIPFPVTAGRAVLDAIGATMDAAQWQEVGRELFDKVRLAARDALLTYLLARGRPPENGIPEVHWRTVAAIYGHLLLDVEMGPCMETSRLRQAMSSVQLFVQRCQLGLEPEVVADAAQDDGWLQWEVMRTYRVWEANVKVRLRPEDLLGEPAFMDIKSQPFRELDGDLGQGEVTIEVAARAALSYLEKLKQISNLKPVATAREKIRDGEVLHVIACRPGDPATHYYRRRDYTKIWQPWEKIDLEIQSEHVLLHLWNGRPFLFWLSLTPRSQDPTTSGTSVSFTTIIDIKLAWSELRDGQWTAQRQSQKIISLEDSVLAPNVVDDSDPKSNYYGFVFRANRGSDDVLWLQLKPYRNPIQPYWDEYPTNTRDAFRVDYPHAEPDVETIYMSLLPTAVPGAEHWLSGQRIAKADGSQYVFQLPYENDSDSDALKKSIGTIALTYSADDDQQEFQQFPFLYRDRQRVFAVFPASHYSRGAVPGFKLPHDFDSWFVGSDILPPLEIIPDLIGPWPPVDPLGPLGPVINPVRQTQLVQRGLRGEMDPARARFYDPQPVKEVAGVFMREPEYAGDTLVQAQARVMQRQKQPSSFLEELGLGQLAGDSSKRPLSLRKSRGFAGKEPSVGGQTVAAMMINASGPSAWSSDVSKVDVTHISVIGRELRTYQFEPFYHPFVDTLIHVLKKSGVEAMLARDVQLRPHMYRPIGPAASLLDYRTTYTSVPAVVQWRHATETLDFEMDGAYAVYNWELFYHMPMLIADRLARSQRFDDARRWLHMILDPRNQAQSALQPDGTPVALGSARYWQTKPLFFNSLPQAGVAADIDTVVERERIERILNVLAMAAAPDADQRLTAADRADLDNFRNQVEESRLHPFRPYAIARLRTSAYQRAVAIKYIQILVQQADQLYRRPTMESVNAATQLYIMAADFRGPASAVMPPRAVTAPQSYATLENRLDEGSNALVQIEAFVTPSAAPAVSTSPSAPPPAMLAFCIPPNEKLTQLWDLIALRLFNIHHCLNIDGAAMRLSLFEPPIDPALLARAVAAGMDIGAALADLDGPTPTRRFRVVIRQAADLAAECRALGSSLLSACQSRDAEKVTLLRAVHERSIAERARDVRALQVREADANRNALLGSRDSALERFRHYGRLLGETNPADPALGARINLRPSRSDTATHNSEVFKMFAQLLSMIPGANQPPGTQLDGIPVNNYEDFELATLLLSQTFQMTSSIFETLAGIANIVPNFNIAPYGCGATFGGSNVGSALSSNAAMFRGLGSAVGFFSTMASRAAQFASRADEWTLQQNLAAREIMQIDRQIIAADLRRQIAQRELANHDLQLQDLATYEDTIKTKFTNQSLYDWMIGRLSDLHFQAYQLAYDWAKRAQRAARIELQQPQLDYIRFGQWDSLHKGLTAAEGLAMDIKRLELAYDEADTIEDQPTISFSLARTNPSALVRFRETGTATFSIPEALIDMQCIGQYMRRIRSIAVTLPCQTGPHAGVHCRLTLLRSSIRISNALRGRQKTYARDDRNDDPRFTLLASQVQSIVTSSGQNDSGQFDPNPQDGHYNLFEGHGCASEWRIQYLGFDKGSLRSLDDVVLHMRFTARDGGEAFLAAAQAELTAALNALQTASSSTGLVRRFSLRHESPAAWQRFMEAPQNNFNEIELPIRRDRFPIFVEGRTVTIKSIRILAKIRRDDFATLGNSIRGDISPRGEPPTNASPLQLRPWLGTVASDGWEGSINIDRAATPAAPPIPAGPATWRLRLQRVGPIAPIPATALEDLEIFVVYALR